MTKLVGFIFVCPPFVAQPFARASTKLLRMENVRLQPVGDNRLQTPRRPRVSAHGLPKQNTMGSTEIDLPTCGMDNYATGSWVRNYALHTSHVCCAWDADPDGGNDFCAKRENKFVQGQWAKNRLIPERTNRESWPYFKFMPTGGHACACNDDPKRTDHLLDIERYDWKPSDCFLVEFDAKRFCSKLRGGSLAVVGDSTAMQAGAALINMIVAAMDRHDLDVACARDITLVASDTLIGFPGDRYPNSVWTGLHSNSTVAENVTMDLNLFSRVSDGVLKFIDGEDHYDFVVLGVGPHIHDRRAGRALRMWKTLLARVSTAIKQRRSRPHPPIFIWKTISGAGCGPKQVNARPDLHGAAYDWDLFERYDMLAKQKMKSLGIPVVDMSMLYLRGDAHPPGDCLHFCSPGPVDVFARILSHVLSSTLSHSDTGSF